MGAEGIQQSNENEKGFLHARNEMQIKLAARFYGFEIDDEQLAIWINDYSAKFADIFTQHPELIDEYIHGDSDMALEEVSELLYAKHDVHA